MTIEYSNVRAVVHLDRIRHNYRLLCEAAGRQVIPIIKCNAYGHGLIPLAKTLSPLGAPAFGVGTVEEAAQLREAGIGQRLIALLGPMHPNDYQLCVAEDIVPFVSRMGQLQSLHEAASNFGTPVDICLKFDTGMHRLGFQPDDLIELLSALDGMPMIRPVLVASHLSCADEPENPEASCSQGEQFMDVVRGLRNAGHQVEATLANSAALLGKDELGWDFCRGGIALYGANPFEGTELADLGRNLQPAMEVTAPVMQIQNVPAGQGVSYGLTWKAERDSRIAIVGVGYADGFSRGMSNRGFMNCGGMRAPIAGRVCMQMTLLDITDFEAAGKVLRPGDTVHMLGGPAPGTITPQELADWWQTITYEAFCMLGMNRHEYKDKGEPV